MSIMKKIPSNNINQHKRFADITLSILEEISRIAEITIEGVLNPYDLKKKMKYDDLNSTKFFNRLRSIERRGYIQFEKDKKNQSSILLTNKGRIKLLESDIDNIIDGKWRIVSFDIPEKLSNTRNTLRRILKKIGFKQIQKSLWICPYNKADKLQLVFDELDINKYVAYFIVEKTDISDYLTRKFKIKI